MWDDWTMVDKVVALSTFFLVLALWMAGLVAWQMRRAQADRPLRRRLGTPAPQSRPHELRLWREGREAVTRVTGHVPRKSVRDRMDHLQDAAGLSMPVETMILWGLAAMISAALVTLILTRSLLAAGAALVLLVLAAQVYLDWRVRRRTARFERQLVSALDLAARSLRAGHPLLASFRLIAEEVPAPVGDVFARVCQQQAMGMSLEQALRQVADESGSSDMKVFATCVVIQMRSGANLADMMDRLTQVIRDRMRLGAHIRVLTAQTRFSKRLLMLVPFVLFLIVNAMNPDYMKPLYTTTFGKVLLVVGGILMIIGGWLMNRMARLRY